MTTLLARSGASDPRVPGVTFPRVLRSERIKLTSLRSTAWMAGGVVGGSVAFAGLIALGIAVAPTEGAEPQAIVTATFGARPALGVLAYVAMFAPILVAALGVLIVSAERSSGLLAATTPAVPRRTPVLAAKLLVSGLTAFVLGLLAAVASWVIVQPGLGALGRADWLVDAVTVQVVTGTALYFALISVLATALASLVRSTAAGIGMVLGVILLLPAMVPMVPVVGPVVAGFLPTAAGMLLLRPVDQAGWASVLTGLAVLLAWAAVAAAAALVLWKRRDV